MHKLFNTLRKRSDFCRRPLVSPDLIGVLLLRRKQLGQTGQTVGYLRVAQVGRSGCLRDRY